MALKAYEVELSDGRKLVFREPRADELTLFLRAMPALIHISKSLTGLQQAEGIFIPVNVSDASMDSLFPLIAKMAGLEEEELRAMPVWDVFAMIMAIKEFIPANFMGQDMTKLDT